MDIGHGSIRIRVHQLTNKTREKIVKMEIHNYYSLKDLIKTNHAVGTSIVSSKEIVIL